MRNTNSFSDSLYTKEPLPADMQKRLIELAKQGSRTAQDELVTTNMRFIRMFASRYSKSDEYTVDELVSEGVSGLIKAIYRFDTSRDLTFMSYAVHWIRQEMSHFIRSKSRLIRQPENRQEDMGFIVFSIDKKVNKNEEEGDTLVDNIEQSMYESPDEAMSDSEISRQIDQLLNEIPQDEAMVVKYRYGLSGEIMSYEDIENATSIKRSRLKHMCEKGLNRIRKNIIFSPNKEELLQYLHRG